MITLYTILIIPLLSIPLMAIIGHHRLAGRLNLIIALINFIAAIFLLRLFLLGGSMLSPTAQFYVDALNITLVLLTTFIGMTTAWFSATYMEHSVKLGRITSNQLRLYYSMYQGFMFSMLLALLVNNIGILWVALEAATLTTVPLVSLYRSPESIEAAWKYFILCIVGIALALFGTVVLYFAAQNTTNDPSAAIFWTVLYEHANLIDPTAFSLAFIFLLVGYGTKIGLVPLHNWLPDAHSESPAPMSALLSGLLLNMGLYALIRFKVIGDHVLHNNLISYSLMGFGLLSFLFAALMLHRQRNIKRMYSYSSIEHMGLMTFAFGLGTPLATFAALFYMLVHSLAKSAVFISVGNVIQLTSTQSMEKIRGLLQLKPQIGWGLLLTSVAIAGMPPFAIFNSEFMIIIAAIRAHIWLALLIVCGMLIALAGLFRHLQMMVYGEPNIVPDTYQAHYNMWPVFLHLGVLLVLGCYMPSFLTKCLVQATNLIAGGVIPKIL